METVKLSLYKKLLEIQRKIIGLGKDKKSFGYDYVTGAKVLENIKPLMNEYGLLLKQEVLSIENTRQDYTTKQGAKSEILSKVMMRFTWIDAETGDKDVNEFGANGQNDWEKGLGSSLTYAERYFLLKYFHISTDEDDIDNPDRKPENSKPASMGVQPEEPNRPINGATNAQKEQIRKTIASSVFTDEERKPILEKVDNFSVNKASQCIEWILAELKTRKQ